MVARMEWLGGWDGWEDGLIKRLEELEWSGVWLLIPT